MSEPRNYWAIWTPRQGWLPASLHVSRTASIKRGMQVCFLTQLGLFSDPRKIARAWTRCRRWGYRCQRVMVLPIGAARRTSRK